MYKKTWIILSCCLVACLSISVAAQEPVFSRRPYLQRPAIEGFTVVWETPHATTGLVEVRLNTGPVRRYTTAGTYTRHAIDVADLPEGFQADYRVHVNELPVTEWAPARGLRPDSETGARFLVFGDCGDGSRGQQQVAGVMKKLDAVDYAFIAGDVVYSDNRQERAGDIQRYLFDVYAGMMAHIPFYTVLGNHDVEFDNGALLLDAMVMPTNNAAATERYYTVRTGNTEWYVLDSNTYPAGQNIAPLWDTAGPQYRWLTEVLQSSSARWKFVVLHHPPYSSGWHGPNNATAGHLRDTIVPLFERYGVDVVFAGHDHNYERTRVIDNPEYPNAPETAGVQYFVTGAAGRRIRWFQWDHAPQSWTVKFERRHNFMVVEVEGDEAHFKAIDEQGTIFDEVRMKK